MFHRWEKGRKKWEGGIAKGLETFAGVMDIFHYHDHGNGFMGSIHIQAKMCPLKAYMFIVFHTSQ